jgi:hypothetical protein
MWLFQAIGLWVIVSLIATPFIGRFLAGRHRRENVLAMAHRRSFARPQRYRIEEPQGVDWDDDDLVAPGIVHLLSWKKAGYL